MATKRAKPKSSKVSVHKFEKKGTHAKKVSKHIDADAASDGKTLPFEIDPKRLEESLKKLSNDVVKWAKKGRYTKVRFKFRGKQLLPDLPLAAVAAVEGLTFYWAGLLRVLVFNLAGRTMFDVELVNDSEKLVQQGKEALLSGELEKALEHFEHARDMDADNANVHLNIGICFKLKGQQDKARAALGDAKRLDPKGPVGAEADRLLGGMGPPATASSIVG